MFALARYRMNSPPDMSQIGLVSKCVISPTPRAVFAAHTPVSFYSCCTDYIVQIEWALNERVGGRVASRGQGAETNPSVIALQAQKRDGYQVPDTQLSVPSLRHDRAVGNTYSRVAAELGGGWWQPKGHYSTVASCPAPRTEING